MDIRERYNTDATFHAVVDMLYGVVAQAQLTPSELREALVFACIKHEERNPRPVMMLRCDDCWGSGLVDNPVGRPIPCRKCKGTGVEALDVI